MPRKLNISNLFSREADALIRAREEAIEIHGSKNISAAGNHVEHAVRDFLKKMLPPRYYVTNGHLIDEEGHISSQLDIIIADSFNLPTIFKAKDGTEFIPAASAFAIGEVKSTYYYSQSYYKKFRDALFLINSELSRPLVQNTAYKLSDNTSFYHLGISSPHKYMNHLFSFFVCIDAGDFKFSKISHLLNTSEPDKLPNMAMVLSGDNSGVVMYAKFNDTGIGYHKYPAEVKDDEYQWCFLQGRQEDEGSREGTHLAILYGQLSDHLSGSHLDRVNAYSYIEKQLAGFSKKSLQWAKGEE